MKQNRQNRHSTHAVLLGGVTGTIVAFGALGLAVVAADTAGAATGVVVSTSKTAKEGTFLVSGKTLYTVKPSKTSCGANCLKIWPPLMLPAGVTTATAGAGVSAAKLGTVARGGGLQVTYGGKPLYYFFKDTSAGKVTGNITDKWGKWSAVVTKKGTGSSSSSGSGNSSAGTGGASF
jgi:predicted lipoprotein with Yx(FWY)xxD motif